MNGLLRHDQLFGITTSPIRSARVIGTSPKRRVVVTLTNGDSYSCGYGTNCFEHFCREHRLGVDFSSHIPPVQQLVGQHFAIRADINEGIAD